eukprot:GHVQ01012590.1.p1 GENE.GHVQ01012590.1~~GHVQ01012590.1.p1  ORF type:complete len:309 (-),score=21.81 GHVQ01012590.1:438-1364(-)
MFDLLNFDTYLRTPQSISYFCVMVPLLALCMMLATDFFSNKLPVSYRTPTQRLAVAASSGFLGGNTNVSAKALMLAAVQIVNGAEAVLSHWGTYVLLLLTVALAVSQLVYLNLGLRRYEAIYIVPTINACLIGSGAIGGVMVLQENPTNWAAFFVGLVISVTGILALTITHTSRDSDKIATKHGSDLSVEVPNEGEVFPTITEAHEAPSIYEQLATSASSMSVHVAFAPHALQSIQSVQELYPPERAELPTGRSSLSLGGDRESGRGCNLPSPKGSDSDCRSTDGKPAFPVDVDLVACFGKSEPFHRQ